MQEKGKKRRRVVPTEQKILTELRTQGRTLKRLEELLENIWMERSPRDYGKG